MNDDRTQQAIPLLDQQPVQLPDAPEFEAHRPGLLANLLIILMILAILATIVWPLFIYGLPSPPPTPTPLPAFLKSA